MIKITTATAAAVLALCAALPATSFARTDAENMRCRAVGQTMTSLGETQAEVVTMLRESMTDATAEDEETLNQLEELAASTKSVGDAISDIYRAAPTPTQAELDELNKAKMDQLIEEAEKCAS